MTMTTTKELLTLLKAHYDGASDYKISKILGITHQSVSAWKTGKSTLSDEMAVRFADILEIPADYVLISMYAERCKKDDISRILTDAAEKLRPHNHHLGLCSQRDFFKIA